MTNTIELLAPAGNIENFFTAIENGADGVYVGAPGFNARNLARELRIEDVAAMVSYCRKNNKRIYIAANSLILEHELPRLIETLGVLEELCIRDNVGRVTFEDDARVTSRGQVLMAVPQPSDNPCGLDVHEHGAIVGSPGGL